MKHSLQLKLSQHLTLTPQLQQSIRLLQLSTVELNQELERYLAENPLLERADMGPPDEAASIPNETSAGGTLRARSRPRSPTSMASPTSTARPRARARTTRTATTSPSSPRPSPRCRS